MILKQYVFPVALCLSISSSQQENVARNLLTIFQNIHLVFENGGGDSWSKDQRPPIPTHANKADAVVKRKDHVISFLESVIAEEVEETSKI
jgi:hypothetical protein